MYTQLQHHKMDRAIVKRPVQSARLERLGPILFPESGRAFVIASYAYVGDVGILCAQVGITGGKTIHWDQALELSRADPVATLTFSVWKPSDL